MDLTGCGSSISDSSTTEEETAEEETTEEDEEVIEEEATEEIDEEQTEEVTVEEETTELATEYNVSNLDVVIWDNNQLAGLQEIADEWTQTSGVTVNLEVVNWENYWTYLETGAWGGEMPDVFWMHSNNVQMYMENDLLLDLDSYIEADDQIDL